MPYLAIIQSLFNIMPSLLWGNLCIIICHYLLSSNLYIILCHHLLPANLCIILWHLLLSGNICLILSLNSRLYVNLIIIILCNLVKAVIYEIWYSLKKAKFLTLHIIFTTNATNKELTPWRPLSSTCSWVKE
jgi:hypothetical protein